LDFSSLPHVSERESTGKGTLLKYETYGNFRGRYEQVDWALRKARRKRMVYAKPRGVWKCTGLIWKA